MAKRVKNLDEIDSNSNLLDNVGENNEKLSIENSNLKDDVEKLNSENAELNKVIEKLNNENAELNKVIKTLNGDNSTLKGDIEKLESRILELENNKTSQSESVNDDNLYKVGDNVYHKPSGNLIFVIRQILGKSVNGWLYRLYSPQTDIHITNILESDLEFANVFKR